MDSAVRPRTALLLLLLAVARRSTVHASVEEESQSSLDAENKQLKERLSQLEEQLKEEVKYSYMVSKGYIVGAEMIYMETMEVAEAKQWCNAKEECKGFSFGGPLESPDDEVTVTFKGLSDDAPRTGLRVEPDMETISYVKESATPFGAVGAAGTNQASAMTSQAFIFEGICIAFALGVALVFACRQRWQRQPGVERGQLLPGP